MRRVQSIVVVVAMLLGPLATASAAEPIELKPVAAPISNPVAAKLSLQGISLGMPQGAVREQLDRIIKSSGRGIVTDEMESLSLGPAPAASTVPVVTWLKLALGGGNTTWIYFGTPATGSAVIAIRQTGTFSLGAAPDREAFEQGLISRFGPISGRTNRTSATPDELGDKLYWTFGIAGLETCLPRECQSATSGAKLTDLNFLRRKLAGGVSTVASADIFIDKADPGHVSGFFIVVEDVRSEVQTFEETLKQLQTAERSGR